MRILSTSHEDDDRFFCFDFWQALCVIGISSIVQIIRVLGALCVICLSHTGIISMIQVMRETLEDIYDHTNRTGSDRQTRLRRP